MNPRLVAAASLASSAVPMGILAYYVAMPARDPLIMGSQLHFWSVGATALASAIACAVVVIAARSLRETRLLFLGLAFMAIGGVFSVHGLLTPGVIVSDFHAPLGVSSWVSVLAGGALVALSVQQLPGAVDRALSRAGSAIFAWGTVVIAGYVVLSMTAHGWLDWAPTDDATLQYLMFLAATALYTFAAWRYWQAFLFARLPAQAAMVVAMSLLVPVPAIILMGEVWHASWWMYHVLYGLAFVVLFTGWAIEARRARTLAVIAEALSMRDALAALDRGKDAQVLELVEAIETKDVATFGHVRRVSAYALAIGKALGLGAADLRLLALAAEMHDVGKIGTPDAILLKPGKLTDAEFAEMRVHATRGREIAAKVRALHEIAPVIGSHHERMNGQGYPHGLAGDAIPLLARIIAVADTYDAMTSERAYRAAMSPDAAADELRRVRATELDARCVDAFLGGWSSMTAIGATTAATPGTAIPTRPNARLRKLAT